MPTGLTAVPDSARAAAPDSTAAAPRRGRGGSGHPPAAPAAPYRRAPKVLQIVEGTNQIQRLVIGRH
ncbi:hypothetical protein AB0F92_01650, partial [Kitasatospora aureofaciens]